MKIIRKIIYPLTIILFVFIFIGTIVIKNNLNKNKYNEIEITNDIIKEENNEKEISKIESIKYNIDIKGAVKKPGV